MKSIIPCKKWDIILVPFPFTDLSATKKRPALVVSPPDYNAGPDLVITFLTSKLDHNYRIGDDLIRHWQHASLPKPSMLRMKFATVDKRIVIKQLGQLDEADVSEFRTLLMHFFGN